MKHVFQVILSQTEAAQKWTYFSGGKKERESMESLVSKIFFLSFQFQDNISCSSLVTQAKAPCIKMVSTWGSWWMKFLTCTKRPWVIGFLRRVVIPLIFPKVPQSSQTESLGFPTYPLPLNTPGTLKEPYNWVDGTGPRVPTSWFLFPPQGSSDCWWLKSGKLTSWGW